MIVSASRRTDLPAFYGHWFAERLRAGFCQVPNPFNPKQVSRVSLRPGDVDAFVFWTRHPRSLLPHLSALDRREIPYYFLYTLMDNPRFLDPGMPPRAKRVSMFRALSDRLGPERVIWRYDPIVPSHRTDADFHREAFARLAGELRGRTRRCKIGLPDMYAKVRRRLGPLFRDGRVPESGNPIRHGPLIADLARIGAEHGIRVESCAEATDMESFGVAPGACVDGDLLEGLFGIDVDRRKDPGQRSRCRCVRSRDIGIYETCVFGCRYCYAVADPDRAVRRRRSHRFDDPALVPLSSPDDFG